MKRIQTRAELVALAEELGVRPDWHEPDNQGVDIVVLGDDFDNAMPAGELYGPEHMEYCVVIRREVDDVRRDVAVVNLATLFAWATGLDDTSGQRIDWKAEHDGALEHLNEMLDEAGIVVTVSLGHGVRDLVTQRNNWRKARETLEKDLDGVLHHAGIDYPTGIRGVFDLVAQRDGQTARAEEAEDQLRDVRARVERLRHNPNLSLELLDELLDAVGDVPITERLTEAQYRSKIAKEVYEFGVKLEREAAHRGVGLAARAIVDEVGDRVGKMPGTS